MYMNKEKTESVDRFSNLTIEIAYSIGSMQSECTTLLPMGTINLTSKKSGIF
jgi:hypothetical protein